MPKRKRRTNTEIATIKKDIKAVLQDEHPMTVRQVFYQLVSRGTIAKTEKEYKNTVVRLLTNMRLEGEIPFLWIADNTRWMRKPRTYSGLKDLLTTSVATYRKSVWNDVDAYVEIWLEKDALAGVLYEVTSEWDVPLMVTRGYPSISYIHEAASSLRHQAKPSYLYYFGDRDPSGTDIPRNLEERLREFAPEVDISFDLVAVTQAQIRQWNLPTRPTKSKDSRSGKFKGDSVEVDAIPPNVLRNLVRDCITQHVDDYHLESVNRIEQQERTTLSQFIERNGWAV